MTDGKFRVSSKNPYLITIQTTVPGGYEAPVAVAIREKDVSILAAAGDMLEACHEALSILKRVWLDPVQDRDRVETTIRLLEVSLSKAKGVKT
jgi:hypothetical protein